MTIAVATLIALLSTVVLIGILRPLAVRLQLVDKPVGRKHHAGEIPLVGGIGMFGGIVAGALLVTGADTNAWYLLLAGGLLVVIGALDDRKNLPHVVRLIAQLSATLIMMFGAKLIIADLGEPFGAGLVRLGPLAFVCTFLITLTVINAFNFMDGVDGLASCMALVTLIAVALAGGWASSSTGLALVAIAAIIGFLVFNFPRTSKHHSQTFMGDAGSTFLGLIVVWLTIAISQGESRHVSPVVGLWFALVPIADFFSCFVQRIASGKSPSAAGRDHAHHILLAAGLNARQVLAVLTSLAALYAGIGLFGAAIGVPDYAMFSSWLALGAAQYWIVKWLAKLFVSDSSQKQTTTFRWAWWRFSTKP